MNSLSTTHNYYVYKYLDEKLRVRYVGSAKYNTAGGTEHRRAFNIIQHPEVNAWLLKYRKKTYTTHSSQ